MITLARAKHKQFARETKNDQQKWNLDFNRKYSSTPKGTTKTELTSKFVIKCIYSNHVCIFLKTKIKLT